MQLARAALWSVFVLTLAVVLSQLAGLLRQSPADDLAGIQTRYQDQLCWHGACAGAAITDIRDNLSKYPGVAEISENQDETCWQILGSSAFVKVCAAIYSDAVRTNWLTFTTQQSLRLGDLVNSFGPPVNIVQNCDISQNLTFANGARAEIPDDPPDGVTVSSFRSPTLSPSSPVSSLILIREPSRTQPLAWRGFSTKPYWPFLCD
ncbi:MAG TPA: hypothetical protein VKQ72_09250 [Aggregatilineales bacterium]|nr:hypothetical protein [Aggregatilineales bacterium]